MHQLTIFDAVNKTTELEKSEIVDLLFEHLQEYGDPKKKGICKPNRVG
jgi:hypothetical protein